MYLTHYVHCYLFSTYLNLPITHYLAPLLIVTYSNSLFLPFSCIKTTYPFLFILTHSYLTWSYPSRTMSDTLPILTYSTTLLRPHTLTNLLHPFMLTHTYSPHPYFHTHSPLRHPTPSLDSLLSTLRTTHSTRPHNAAPHNWGSNRGSQVAEKRKIVRGEEWTGKSVRKYC